MDNDGWITVISKRCDDDTANVLSLSPQPTMSSAQLTVLKTSPSHSNSAPLQESLRTQPIGLILPSESSTNDVCELLVTTPGSYLPEDSEVDSSEVSDLVDIEVCSELQPITKEDRLELPHTLLENCGTTQQDEERAESPSGSEANSSLPSSKIASTDNEGIQKVTLRRGSGTCTKKSKIWDRDSLKKATELHQAGKVVLRFIDNGELHLSKILCSRELLTVLFGRENFRTRPNQLLLKHFSPYDITDRCNSRTLFRSRVFSFKVSSKLFNYGKHCLNFIEKGESGTVTPPANYLHRIPSSTQSSFEESRNVEAETNQKPSVSGRAAPSFGHLFSKISMHSQEVRRAIESHFEQSPAPRPIEDNRNEDTGNENVVPRQRKRCHNTTSRKEQPAVKKIKLSNEAVMEEDVSRGTVAELPSTLSLLSTDEDMSLSETTMLDFEIFMNLEKTAEEVRRKALDLHATVSSTTQGKGKTKQSLKTAGACKRTKKEGKSQKIAASTQSQRIRRGKGKGARRGRPRKC